MIHIVYRTGKEDLVTPKFLDILIYLGQVQMFKRSDSWIVVGVDTLRAPISRIHNGADRRQHKATALPATVGSGFWPKNTWLHN